jgi:hypothetical protein
MEKLPNIHEINTYLTVLSIEGSGFAFAYFLGSSDKYTSRDAILGLYILFLKGQHHGFCIEFFPPVKYKVCNNVAQIHSTSATVLAP